MFKAKRECIRGVCSEEMIASALGLKRESRNVIVLTPETLITSNVTP